MKVLVIDDQPEALKQIEKAISSAKAPEGETYDVVGELDHRAALRRINEERFDIVVTDMYMGPEEDEGLAILRELTDKSPITIVLTAYARIPNCVEAMRAGAWDYLEKMPEDESDAYENLLRSMRSAYRERLAHPETARSAADTRWVHRNFGDLSQKFPGEVIAVLDQQVVDHDPSFDELSQRVADKFPLAKPAMVAIPDTRVDAV